MSDRVLWAVEPSPNHFNFIWGSFLGIELYATRREARAAAKHLRTGVMKSARSHYARAVKVTIGDPNR